MTDFPVEPIEPTQHNEAIAPVHPALTVQNTPALMPIADLQMQSRAWVEIDLDAIAANVRALRERLVPDTTLMAIVKADAYGHGAVPVAQAALSAGASWLGVATVGEGVSLREAGIDAPILVLEAVCDRERAIVARDSALELTVAFPKQAIALSEIFAGSEIALPVHVNIDTGMSRLGCDWTQAASFVRLLRCLSGLELKTIYSHLATADEPDPGTVREQHQRFETVLAELRENERGIGRAPWRERV